MICDRCGSDVRVAFNAVAGIVQCGPCRDRWTSEELDGGRHPTVRASGVGAAVLDYPRQASHVVG